MPLLVEFRATKSSYKPPGTATSELKDQELSCAVGISLDRTQLQIEDKRVNASRPRAGPGLHPLRRQVTAEGARAGTPRKAESRAPRLSSRSI